MKQLGVDDTTLALFWKSEISKSPLGGKLPNLVGGNNSEAITLSPKSPKESSGNNNRKGIQKR